MATSPEATASKPEDDQPSQVPEHVATKKKSAFDSVREASRLINGMKWPVFKRLLIVLFFMVIIPFALALLLALLGTAIMPNRMSSISVNNSPLFRLILYSIVQIPIIIITIQMIIMGVRRSIGLPMYLEKINAQCMQVKWELAQLIVILILLGDLMSYFVPFFINQPIPLKEVFSLLIIFLIYWAIILPILLFAIPQIVTQKQRAIAALMTAYQHAAQYWKKILVCYGLLYLPYCLIGIVCNIFYMSVILLNCFIVLKLVLSLWILPLAITLGGILFREAYQLQRPTEV